MGSSFDRRFGFCLSVLAPFLARASASIDPHFSGASHGTDFIYNQAFQLDLSSSSSPDTMETIETYTDTGKHSFQDGCIPHTRPHPVVRSDVVYKSEMSSANTNNINDDNYNNDSSSLWILGERDTLPLFQIDSEAPNNNVRPQNVIYQVNLLNGDKRVNSNDEEEEEENDDEDNDDDNDGHSSMLSNASLRFRKSLVFASPLPNGLSSSASIQSVLSRLRGGGTNSPITDSAQSLIHTVLSSEICKRLIVTAVVTLLFEASMGHIFEFLKIVLQTAEHETTYMQEIRKITAAKGLVGLWDGFCPWGIVQAVSKGAVFGLAHSSAMQVLVPLAEKGVLPMPVALALAGGVGGGLQGYVLSPTLLLKTRVMTNAVFREKMSLLRTTFLSFRIGYDVVKDEGLIALMKGANVFAAKRVFDWATRFLFADMFEAMFGFLKNGKNLSVTEKSVSSLLGGVFSTFFTLPLDVLVAKAQDAKKAGVKVSAWQLFHEELKEKGVSGLRKAYMRGFEARLLHVCLTTLVIKTGTPLVYDALYGSINK